MAVAVATLAAAGAAWLGFDRVALAAPGLDPIRSLDHARPAAAAGDAPPAGGAPAPAPYFRRLADATAPATSAAPAAPSTTPAAAAPAKSCGGDQDCPDDTICENAVCRRIEQRVNVFYLYYQEGGFREILGLYWSKRGNTGYTVVAPFYWNFFSPTSRSRVVAPFYWHFEDDAAQRTSTVIVPILPISWSRQPDARSFGVWPVFYASTKFGWAAPLLGSFKIGDPDHGRAFGALAFLYWWQRSPDHAFDLAFPLFVSNRSSGSAFTFALPLNFYWRTKDDAKTLAIPFFYRHSTKNGAGTYSLLGFGERDGKKQNGSLLWLYWYGRDYADGSGHDVFFPLLWSFRSKDSGTSVFFPLVWDFRGESSRTTVAGPVIHWHDGASWMNAVFPLWWSGGDAEKPATAWRFRMLLPLVFWRETDAGKNHLWLTPIGGYGRNDRAGSRTLLVLPAFFFRRDPHDEVDVVTPLYFRHHDVDADATTRLVSILLYLRDDPAGSTKVVFPLFWRFHDRLTDATATAFLPLFFRRSGPRDTTTFVGPFYWRTLHDVTEDGAPRDVGWGAGLFPVAFFGRKADASHAVLFPFLWRFADARQSTTVVFPVFAHHGNRRPGQQEDTWLAPLFYRNRTARGSATVVFPFLWRFADDREGKSITVTPIGFYGRTSRPDGESWRLGVGPLLPIVWAGGGGPRRHFVLFPVFWHFADDRAQESSTVVATYWHRSRGDETTDAFFPLFYYRRGARPGGNDETTLALPVLYYRRDAFVRVLLTPVGGSVAGPRRAAGFVGPYLWYRSPTLKAAGVPFLYADVTRLDTSERTRQWGPVFAIDAPDRRARIVLPFFGRYQDQRETDTYVFPSYFRQRKADGYAVDTFLPLFWHSTFGSFSTTVVGPWYRRSGPEVHNTGLVPLYFWAHNRDRTLLLIPPLLTFHLHDYRDDSAITFAGLFYRNISRQHEATVLFPFWWSGRDGQQRHRVLGPLYWHFENGATDSEWSLLLPFYWSRTGTTRLRALLPVAWYTRDDKLQSGSEALMPIFYSSHGPDHFTLYTLLGGVSHTPTTRRWYAGPVFVSDTVESSTRAVFPLYFSHFNRSSETRTRIFLPLLHFSRENPERSLSTWVALFWRRTDVASATTLLLPLFYDVHDYRQRRTTVLLPLFIRHTDETANESILLAPLVYRRSAPKESTTVVFPLWWDFKRADRRTTLLIPLFAHWTRPTYAGTYVFPIFYYRKGLVAGKPDQPDGTWRLFIPPLFDAAVQRPGDLRWEILGGLFGKERIGRNHYLKLFFFSIQTQKASAVQTSWYGQPRRPARAHPSRGLATNTW